MIQYKLFSLPMMLVLSLFTTTILLSSACNRDDDDNNPNEEELITSVILTFTTPGGTSTAFSFKDTDGDGGANPVVQNITLAAATNYSLTVQFLDESNPANVEDITVEVAEESNEHLVCFGVEGGVPQPTIDDTDGNGKPLGLSSKVVTTTAGAGKITVSLKHQPDKNAATPCSTGDTDVEATFNVAVN
ncbi:MAG: hypothetical protein SH848_06755 [Saprospiraceae bacterium]|nr:hypothetical protein [Saprospiraceae bacterium]MDZ4703609.1 hypothetical protein [Saprospiraceae bacterium]